MHTNVCVRGIRLVLQVCPFVGPWFEMLPLFCKLFVSMAMLTRDFFLQNFRPQVFRDSYFAEMLQMKFVCSSEYTSQVSGRRDNRRSMSNKRCQTLTVLAAHKRRKGSQCRQTSPHMPSSYFSALGAR